MQLVAALLAALFSTLALAQTRLSISPELSVGAGYDDNLFLDPALTGATPPRADAVIDVRPSLLAGVAHGGHLVLLDAEYLERITPSNGDFRDLFLRLSWRTPTSHRLRLLLAPQFEHYEATLFSDNTFNLGGAEAALRVYLPRAWLQALFRVAGREYSQRGQLDVEEHVGASAHVDAHRAVACELGYRYLHLGSNAATAALDRHRVETALIVRPTWWLVLTASYALWQQTLPNGATPPSTTALGGPRGDLAHAFDALVRVQPLSYLELFARYDLIRSTSDDPLGGYQLDQFVAGVIARYELAREKRAAPSSLLPVVRGRDVTFVARARPGATVAVVGDWNGWQPAPLSSAGGDRFEATYTLPPGRHPFALSVDGRISAPPAAEAFENDGFGGKNGIVVVP